MEHILARVTTKIRLVNLIGRQVNNFCMPHPPLAVRENGLAQ